MTDVDKNSTKAHKGDIRLGLVPSQLTQANQDFEGPYPSRWRTVSSMRHRHLVYGAGFIPPAIDDIISRGLWRNWVELRQATREDPSLLDTIERICLAYTDDPYAQRYHFWLNYVRYRRECA